MVCPFHVYGSWLVQMAVLVVLVKVGLTVQYQCGDRITTTDAGQVSGVSAGRINGLSIPCVWQLVGTDGCISSAG